MIEFDDKEPLRAIREICNKRKDMCVLGGLYLFCKEIKSDSRLKKKVFNQACKQAVHHEHQKWLL